MEFNRILVPVAGTETDEEALELAYRLSQNTDSVIYAVHVISVGRDLPLDAEVESEISKAEDILGHFEEFAQKLKCRVETEMIQARDVGPAIVDEAIERSVDLILIGVSYKTRFGEFCLGDVIPHILCNAPCRVILYHKRDTEGEAE